MSQPPVPPEPPTQPLPQPQTWPLQEMPPGSLQPPYGPAPVQEQPKKPKRFGWPTVIITAVAALGIGGLVGGTGEGSTAAPAATATVTETQSAPSDTAQQPEPEPTKEAEPEKTEKPEPKAAPAQTCDHARMGEDRQEPRSIRWRALHHLRPGHPVRLSHRR